MQETVMVCTATVVKIQGQFRDVKEWEEALERAVREGALELYRQYWRLFQEQWLEARRDKYEGVRWRSRRLLTPYGETEVPTRVVRQRGVRQGGYHSLGKIVRRGMATRELTPAMERAALEAATEQNYRPAAARLRRWWGVRISHWVVWSCVQYYGAKLQEQLQRDWWPDRPQRQKPAIVVTEVDSAILKTQRRGKLKGAPRHFAMHVGMHYSGRERVRDAGRRDVRLQGKLVLQATGGIGRFGTRLRKYRDRHYGIGGYLSVVLSDGDEGLRWIREREFEGSKWLLDRWHVAERVRDFVGSRHTAFDQIMAGVYASDSEQVLQELRRHQPHGSQARWQKFRELFGYILGNRDGIDAWKELPAWCRRSHGRFLAPVKTGSGAIEKQIEVHTNRRFKWQGRSWNPLRADRLAQLAWLQRDPQNWHHWWNKVCLATTKVNPSWAS